MILAATDLADALMSSTMVAGTLGGALGAAIVIFTLGTRVGSSQKEAKLRLERVEADQAETKQEMGQADKFTGVLELLTKLVEARIGGIEEATHEAQRRLIDGDKRFDLLTSLAAQVKALEAGNATIIRMLGSMPTRRECDLRHGIKSGDPADD